MAKGFLPLFLNLLLLCFATGLLSTDYRRQAEDDRKQSKAILEMLHIDKVSASHQGKPHPYMRKIYQRLGSSQGHDLEGAEGTLVQSIRSSEGPDHAPPGWIWFNITALNPSLLAAELVLFRKTLHPYPLSLTITLHSITMSRDGLHESPALEERLLNLDKRTPSGYDVFNVSTTIALRPVEMIGFQLRYTDESESLVLHEALTRSLYSMDKGSLREPILVLYQSHVVLN